MFNNRLVVYTDQISNANLLNPRNKHWCAEPVPLMSVAICPDFEVGLIDFSLLKQATGNVYLQAILEYSHFE